MICKKFVLKDDLRKKNATNLYTSVFAICLNIHKETCAKVIHYRAEWWRDLDIFGSARAKDTIVTLTSDPKASAFDHEFMSPTYQTKLRQHITNYIQSRGE